MMTFSVALFVALVACVEAGWRLGTRDRARCRAPQRGVGTVDAAVFALLGLLLGFAFAGAMTRFQERRRLIIEEANAIQTAYLRLDLLSENEHEVRHVFREYLDARIRVYQDVPEDVRGDRITEAMRLQRHIWNGAVAASRADSSRASAQVVLPALNEMIAVTTARTLALRTRMPTLILALLSVVALLTALMAGYGMSSRGRRSPFHTLAYAACVSVTVYAVLDLDNPREGFIHLYAAESLLEELRQSIHE